MARKAFRQQKKSSGGWWGTIKTIIIAVLIALGIRTFLYEPFHIPSGSMVPTLLIGDYLLISKFSYGYSRFSFPAAQPPFEGRFLDGEPERGDVIVFQVPSDPFGDPYIKRLIGLPGDRIQMREGRLYINGELVDRAEATEADVAELGGEGYQEMTGRLFVETMPGGTRHLIREVSDSSGLDNTPVFCVPEGHYFFMGDNRDQSQDSRFGWTRDNLSGDGEIGACGEAAGEAWQHPEQVPVGFVPYQNLVGRADVIWFSIEDASFFEVWRWPDALRFERIFDGVH